MTRSQATQPSKNELRIDQHQKFAERSLKSDKISTEKLKVLTTTTLLLLVVICLVFYGSPNYHSSPVDCVMDVWQSWTVCDKSCGFGVRTRIRSVLVQPMNGGEACLTVESQSCNTIPCPIQSCVLGDWSEWSVCTKSCGSGLTQRTRKISTKPDFGEHYCDETVEVKDCDVAPCPVDCVTTEWTEFSKCSQTCGGGISIRTRSILVQPMNGGKTCHIVESQSCNSSPCPIQCECTVCISGTKELRIDYYFSSSTINKLKKTMEDGCSLTTMAIHDIIDDGNELQLYNTKVLKLMIHHEQNAHNKNNIYRKIANALSQVPTLQALIIRGQDIGDVGAEIISMGLPHVIDLQTLDLYLNKIGAVGAGKIAQNLKYLTKLQTLNLGWNPIGNEGAGKIANNLKYVTKLQTLDLSRNAIGNDGAIWITDNLRYVRNLTTLNLGFNSIGEFAAMWISKELQYVPNLRTLDFEDNLLGASGADYIRKGAQYHVPNLQTLKL